MGGGAYSSIRSPILKLRKLTNSKLFIEFAEMYGLEIMFSLPDLVLSFYKDQYSNMNIQKIPNPNYILVHTLYS